MAKCGFCSEDIKAFDGNQAGYLVASTNELSDGKYGTHVHGTLADKNIVEDLIDAQIKETGLTDLYKKKFSSEDKLSGVTEIVFHNRQRIGDMFMFTCGVRDFKKAYPKIRVNVISTCGHIWDNNPHIDRSINTEAFKAKFLKMEAALPEDERKKKNVYEVEPGKLFVKVGPSKLTNRSNSLDWHFANAFRVSMEDNLGVSIPQGESRGEVWITEEEYNAPRITEKPYWIIITGGEKGWGCKMYPTVRWQEVVNQNPDILFYQLGAKGDNHVRLTGPNVVDYIGKTEDRNTGIRDLIKLFLNAEGSIGLVSFHMHLSGALKKPAVVVAGAREPVSFTRYAGHQYIANDGCLPCATTACWHCDLNACTNRVTVGGEVMPKCVDMIKSEDVTRYLRRYYDGGRLKIDTPSSKPIGLNVVKGAKIVAPTTETPASKYNTYGLTFNGGALTERDWEFIQDTIKENGVKTVLEFGAGLSTLLLNDIGLQSVLTLEDKQGWVDKLKALSPKCNVQLWDGKSGSVRLTRYDMAFVDGPAGDQSREDSTKLAASKSNIVIVHDAGREWARKYQEQYLVPNFDGPFKGGHRCHLWKKKGGDNGGKATISTPIVTSVSPVRTTPVPKSVATKTVKIVSTARGWGGCARSITTMMKMLLEDGHKVEFIPFRNEVASKEFKEWLKENNDVKVTLDYESVKESCDTLLMYADDYIWEFDNGDICEAFSNIGASKKIMALNYRRGKVGNAEWTKGWDKYLFLNKTQERELLNTLPGVSTRVLAPCTDLGRFFMNKPDFDIPMIRAIRHSSQGDTKFPKNFGEELEAVLASREDLHVRMMPGPSFVPASSRFEKWPRTADVGKIADFLETGNLFWYSLPDQYMDMGPRVILEAMAAGLPVLADNWGGAQDRVTPDTGWLCNTKESMRVILANVKLSELKSKGEAARQRAHDEFDASQWIKEICG